MPILSPPSTIHSTPTRNKTACLLLNRSKARSNENKLVIYFLLVFCAASCHISASPRCRFSAIFLVLEYRIRCLKYIAYCWKPLACNLSLIVGQRMQSRFRRFKRCCGKILSKTFKFIHSKTFVDTFRKTLFTSEFIYPRESRRCKWKSCRWMRRPTAHFENTDCSLPKIILPVTNLTIFSTDILYGLVTVAKTT